MSGEKEIYPAHGVFSVRIRKVTSRAEIVTRYVRLSRSIEGLTEDLKHAERMALEGHGAVTTTPTIVGGIG